MLGIGLHLRMWFGHIRHALFTTGWKRMLLILSEDKDTGMCITVNIVQVKVREVAKISRCV